jgi:hypothetical protein
MESAPAFHEFFIGSLFDNLTRVKDHDAIGPNDRRESMGDDYPSYAELGKIISNDALSNVVESARCFVELAQ